MCVNGEVECPGASYDIDPWIPLKVSWWLRRQVQPLYLRIAGSGGGEIEVKIDPDTGALLQFIVIEEPPVLEVDPRSSAQNEQVILGKAPMLDRSPWGLDEEVRSVKPRSVFSTFEDLAIYRDSEIVVVRLSKDVVVRRLRCREAAVGIALDWTMVTVEVAINS